MMKLPRKTWIVGLRAFAFVAVSGLAMTLNAVGFNTDDTIEPAASDRDQQSQRTEPKTKDAACLEKSIGSTTGTASIVSDKARCSAGNGKCCSDRCTAGSVKEPDAHSGRQAAIQAAKTVRLKVGGMTCQRCVWSVENALTKVDGVKSANVSIEDGQATVTFDSGRANIDGLIAAISKAGGSRHSFKAEVQAVESISLKVGVMTCQRCARAAEDADPPSLKGLTLTEIPAPVDGAKAFKFVFQRDDKQMDGFVVIPHGDGPFPAVVLNHAGGRRPSAETVATGKNGQFFVRNSYAIIATNYTYRDMFRGRGSRPRNPDARPNANPRQDASPKRDRRGANDSDKTGQRKDRADAQQDRPTGRRPTSGNRPRRPPVGRPEDIRRTKACIEILDSFPNVDKQRIAMYGHSLGAFQTIHSAGKTDRVKVAAITAGGLRDEETTDIKIPFIIFQGENDRVVQPQMARNLKKRLDEAGVKSVLKMYPDATHGVVNEKRDEVFPMIAEFFAKHLNLERSQ